MFVLALLPLLNTHTHTHINTRAWHLLRLLSRARVFRLLVRHHSSTQQCPSQPHGLSASPPLSLSESKPQPHHLTVSDPLSKSVRLRGREAQFMIHDVAPLLTQTYPSTSAILNHLEVLLAHLHPFSPAEGLIASKRRPRDIPLCYCDEMVKITYMDTRVSF